ncbi:MAG: transposase [Oscillospiraceae bacterium]|nr:transposase [Oscillospiraceae bacterium]
MNGKSAKQRRRTQSGLAGITIHFSIERIVEVRGHCSRETSYYISSRDACAKQLMELAREHWKIESMHWILDVTFSEDACPFSP